MQILRRFFVLVLCASLCACQSDMNFNYPPLSPTAQGAIIGAASGAAIGAFGTTGGSVPAGLVVGGLLGAAIGHQFERHATLAQQLRQQGIEIIQVGDEVDVILPADKVFFDYSPHMNPNYYPVLQKVAAFMRQFNKTTVKVSVHTDNTQCCSRALSLTRQQAQSLASFLWEVGIDARLIYGVGYGFNCPIAFNESDKGRATNRRIEIQFWRIPKADPM